MSWTSRRRCKIYATLGRGVRLTSRRRDFRFRVPCFFLTNDSTRRVTFVREIDQSDCLTFTVRAVLRVPLLVVEIVLMAYQKGATMATASKTTILMAMTTPMALTTGKIVAVEHFSRNGHDNASTRPLVVMNRRPARHTPSFSSSLIPLRQTSKQKFRKKSRKTTANRMPGE